MREKRSANHVRPEQPELPLARDARAVARDTTAALPQTRGSDQQHEGQRPAQADEDEKQHEAPPKWLRRHALRQDSVFGDETSCR